MKTDESAKTPQFPNRIKELLTTMGLSAECKPLGTKKNAGWSQYKFTRKDGNDAPVPVLFLEHKTKTIPDAKRQVPGLTYGIVLFHLKSGYSIYLKTAKDSSVFTLDDADTCVRVGAALSSAGFASAGKKMQMSMAIMKSLRDIPTITEHFNNKGVFSTHYLKNKMLDGSATKADGLEEIWKGDAAKSLRLLGWADLEGKNVCRSKSFPEASIVIVEKGVDFGIRKRGGRTAPSYVAVAELAVTPWVILTDGITWRLYTSRVSASTTNYFEIRLQSEQKMMVLQYLVAIFGADSYVKRDGKARIDVIFDNGRDYVREIEDNLAERIIRSDGVFVDLAKGVLGYDGTKTYTSGDLASARKTALKIMYRIWFLLYAESRDLLPTRDEKYAQISLTSLRYLLDSMESSPDAHDCWKRILELFGGIRNGSRDYNLPQYNGDLFKNDPEIDGINIRNSHAVRALRGFMERDGEPVDYASLGVRHLGNIYETLMEFEVRQADRDIMLVADGRGVREVASRAESTYSYKKNDLYIVSRTGSLSRKSSGSYYTPHEMVSFLVRRGLEPILREREEALPVDLDRHKKRPSEETRRSCMDKLLDIQVLDPSMGSGHFLVEALNQITGWATTMLRKYPEHPLLAEIERDRHAVMSEQKKRGITINEGLLTYDVLLKRRVMKRCIFGVDINPLAVEIARVSLWLDSFAIGVPLTYLNHHIKAGDSTMGAWRSDVGNPKGRSLDGWIGQTDGIGSIMERVSKSADVTINQIRTSKDAHSQYEQKMYPHKEMLDVYCAAQIDKNTIPKTARKNGAGYMRRVASQETSDAGMQNTLATARRLKDRYGFFHWELEMMDAFVDARSGFDLIVGNPPWDKVKPSDDEFFTRYYPAFRAIDTKPKKITKQDEILKDPAIRKEYDGFRQSFREKSEFYKTYALQGIGDRDMWQIMMERMLDLVSEGGVISVLIPSQILSNTGSAKMREQILDSDVLQMYVFENRKKIFPIDSRYRFVLLTIRNTSGGDGIPSGFYLHNLSSLETKDTEKEKFHTISKRVIRDMSPGNLHIPEVGGETLAVLAKMSACGTLGMGLGNGWSVALSRGFDKTNDADLLREDGSGWPVLEGSNIHQFNHAFARHAFTASISAGLQREERKRTYRNASRKFYHSFRLAFRDITSSTNMRTVIAAIIPPQEFHTYSMRSVVLSRNGRLETSDDYNKQIAYLCGIFNSMSFDFVSRSKVQMHMSTVIKTIPIPSRQHYENIANLSARLVLGSDEFEGFAESLGMEKNVFLTPSERIHTTAKLDALVAHAYGLTKKEYETVLASFKFKENPDLLGAEHADFNDNKVLRQFYGEVRRLAPSCYDDTVETGR